MQISSTRNKQNIVTFSKAIVDCLPQDGGMYVPAHEMNLRPWIYYMNENTSFSSIAGALTSALINEELSPIISENKCSTEYIAFFFLDICFFASVNTLLKLNSIFCILSPNILYF